MKLVHVLLFVCCFALVLPGCGGKEENSLATDTASADDFAKYEADLAKANGEAGYEDEE